ncbi:MAG: DUF502 domain-containing protein [Verrucomicrobia bacterium]|nr:DUF502 domain-containing protein [Verrucomicrobiota bacterium]MDE3098229.1 DUF502 domain-containing protein [Verrucomicrobiota bacterium]
MRKSLFGRWRASFFAGLVVSLPAIISVAAMLWIFQTLSNFTDLLLFFVPQTVTHRNHGEGPTYWYWSAAAILLAVFLISFIGVLARYYVGKRLIEWMDTLMLHVPVLNKFYGAIKQVNDSFTGHKTSFKTVVLVEFPHPGVYSLGFVTSEQNNEIPQKLSWRPLCVFVPTTPNPTAGFLLLVPEEKAIKLDMTVADGVKYIVSLGAIAPPASVFARPGLRT